MLDNDVDQERKIIPRLRNFKTTLALGELDRLSRNEPDRDFPVNIDEQLDGWKEHKTLPFATDLVGSSIVLDKFNEIEEVQDAAKFILSDESHSNSLQKRIAGFALLDKNVADSSNLESYHPDTEQLIEQSKQNIKHYRHLLREAPRNPINLVEIAREFATLGSIDKALKSMDIAVSLAPNNRFVLRSAASLYVHAGEFDKAHYILRNAQFLRSDPWLLAAEIAVASKRNLTSKNIKIGMQHISDANFSKFEVSELASSIATLEVENGSKRARKLFKQALIQPTENSIAQAEWASRAKHIQNIEASIVTAPFNYEASAWNQFVNHNLIDASNLGIKWVLDQPFAINPVLFTAMVTIHLEDFDLSRKLYEFGLRANPVNNTLRNNLAFVLASDGLIEESEVELLKLDRSNLSDQDKIAITATEGLIKFRKGLLEEGRKDYMKAVQMATESKEYYLRFRALTYLAREEVYAKTKNAETVLELALKEAKTAHVNIEDFPLVEKLRKMLQEQKISD